MNDQLSIAVSAVTKAGDYLKKQFLQRHVIRWKNDSSVLLGEDIKSEEILIQTIGKSFSGDSFWTEESETKIASNRIWIFDPLCGSFSYLRGVETWSISAALLMDDSYQLGVVYQPLIDNIFTCEKGKGAFHNKQQIYPAKTRSLSDAFVSVEHGVFTSAKYDLRNLIPQIKRIRVGHGSGGELAYVAAGYLDAVIKTGQTLEHFAGGRAIVEEAGALFVDFSGKRAPTLFDKTIKIDYIATNRLLLDKLLKFV